MSGDQRGSDDDVDDGDDGDNGDDVDDGDTRDRDMEAAATCKAI